MKNLFTLSFILVNLGISAQNVGINTTGAVPNASAMLDVVSTNKGLLIPRVALSSTASNAPIGGGIATSLMVYNTATVSDVTPGYYYWNGTAWVRFLNSGDAWQITGNTGTTSGTNFVGTTNGQALDFRTNNTLRFRIANGDQVHALVDGTMALPFYSFNNNTNMGMYRAAADVLALGVTGAERWRITGTEVVVNENANAVNFRVEGAGNANLLVTSSANSAIGFNRAPIAQSVGGAVVVNDMAYPFEIGNDGGGALQATIGWFNGSDVIMVPETNAWGFVGNATRAWWRMNSYGFITISSKEKKREITPIVGNDPLEDYLMAQLDQMNTYLYKYNMEEDELDVNNYTKYRPMMHIGTILEETPDFLKDAGFSGVDNYAIASLAITGVKVNREDIKQLKSEIRNVSSFGSVEVNNTSMTIPFDAEFMHQIGTQIPIITLSCNSNEVQISVTKKTNEGFTVNIQGKIPNGLYIDWIAMATRATESKTTELDANLKKQLEVPSDVKIKMQELYGQSPTLEPSIRK